jgi:hypothetical protein
MKSECKVFRANNWEDAIAQAQAFIGTLSAPAQVLSVSHVSEPPYGVVFVWYTS